MTTRTTLALIRGWRLPEVAGGLLLIVAATYAAPRLVDLPNLQGGMHIATPFGSFAAAGCAVLCLLSASEPCPEVFGTVPRQARVVNVTRVLLVMAAGPVVVASLGSAHLSPLVSTTLALTGEGLIFAAVGAGLRLAWLLPIGHLLAAAVAGPRGMGSLHSWAWILDPNPSTGAMTASLIVAAAGLGSWAVVAWQRSSLLGL